MYKSWLDRLGLHRPELRAWALYDVANSAWMTTIMTAVFPDFFVVLATAAGLTDPQARSRFAFATAISVILVGLTGPFLGAIADLRGSKKTFLAAFVALYCASIVVFFLFSRYRLPVVVALLPLAALGASELAARLRAHRGWIGAVLLLVAATALAA